MDALKDAVSKDKEIYSMNLDILKWTNVWAGLSLNVSPWSYRENSECFDRICFYIPNENDMNKIYIVSEDRISSLLKDDFICKKYGQVYECFK